MKKIKLTPISTENYYGTTFFIKENIAIPYNDAPDVPLCDSSCIYYDNDDYEAPCRNCYGLLKQEQRERLKNIKNQDKNYHKYYTSFPKN